MRLVPALFLGLVTFAPACGPAAPAAVPPATRVVSASSPQALPTAEALAPSPANTEPPTSPEPAPTAQAPLGAAPQGPEEGAAPAIPAGTAVLHFGDSFVLAGFAQALRPRMKTLGVRYAVKSEQSSYTVTWAQRVEQIVADTQPDLVIITLGANEVANINPVAHAPAVRRIVQIIGERSCVWVSPPMWRRDTGILDVIRQNSAPCRFFDSDKLVTDPIPRRNDKIHPDEKGGEVWAEAFWRWLMAERVAPGKGKSPWTLRPSPPEEHQPKASLPSPAAP